MLLIDKRSIATITRAVRRNSNKVRLTATWNQLNQYHGIGTLFGSKTLQLSEHDHRILRALLEKDMNFNLLQQSISDLEGDRLKLATGTRNEKVSRVAVTADIVMVAAVSGELVLPSGVYRHPVGGNLNVPASELHGLERVVLVENLSVMYALQRYLWPEEVKHLPMLFRGSPQRTPAAVTAALSGVLEVICFPDYDPQGLRDSLTQRKVCAIVLPATDTIKHIVNIHSDKPADFTKQQSARDWLSKRQIAPVKTMLSQELAISQESMADMELEILHLSASSC